MSLDIIRYVCQLARILSCGAIAPSRKRPLCVGTEFGPKRPLTPYSLHGAAGDGDDR